MTTTRPTNEERALEDLARIEHERWAHWQSYLHSLCIAQDDGSLIIPARNVERWTRQIATQYGDLSEPEKRSDRAEARRSLPVLQRERMEERERCAKIAEKVAASWFDETAGGQPIEFIHRAAAAKEVAQAIRSRDEVEG